MIQVKTFYAFNELRNFSYLVYDGQTGEAWAIDPWDAEPFKQYIKTHGLALKGILNTHQHFDHIRGNAGLMESFSCSVRKLTAAEKITLNDEISLESLDTPGHTMDHQVFILRDAQQPFALFSGDTLFNAGVGNCRGGGDVGMLYETTRKLLDLLPPETRLYPGHDYIQRNLEFALKVEPDNSVAKEWLKKVQDEAVQERGQDTLADELSFNPFLRLNSAQMRENLLPQWNKLEGQDEVERNLFYKLRTLRDNW